jgi:hypothetical protein
MPKNDTKHTSTQHNDTQYNEIQHNSSYYVSLSFKILSKKHSVQNFVMLGVNYAECRLC